MRPVGIDPARGADTSIDPAIAPEGSIVRVENMRIDKLGRLVLRNGYVSLGTGISNDTFGGQALVPRDLYNMDGALIAAGNINAANQTGIRTLAKYQPGANAPWHVETVTGVITANDASNIKCDITPVDNVSIVTSEQSSTATNDLIADAAVSTNRLWACLVSSDATRTRVMIVDLSTGQPAYVEAVTETNGRVLSINNQFYVFTQTGTTINVRTKNPATSGALSGATAVATGTSAAPCAYDVALFENATDYLIAFPTGTGYTWRRFNSANAQQTTQNVVSLAAAPVAICGATGETVNVINVRTTNGVELRTFDPVTAALSVGPTNIDTLTLVYEWVSITRFSTTQVHCAFISSTPNLLQANKYVTTAAHVIAGGTTHGLVRQSSKTFTVDGRVFSWQALGNATARPYGLVVHGIPSGSNSNALAATLFDGAARTLYPAAVVFHKSNVSRTGTAFYAAVISFDPRNKTYRANLATWEVFSGKRRQGVVSGGQLYLAGGMLTAFDGRISVDVGFETNPVVAFVSQVVGGALTLLGTYNYVGVYRSVSANGEVTQSGPSDPLIVTLTGGNQTINGTITFPYNSRQSGVPSAAGAKVFVDLYRTEAGGSIPRFLSTQECIFTDYGGTFGFSDLAADSVVQTGAALYTQGADGDVSGRLPIGSAGPCRVLTDSGGKLLLGGLPVGNEVRLSTEKRPGETASFVNDDIFFVASQDQVQAVVSADNGRRILFGRSNLRELIGEGPNAAGVGDISDPIETEDRVGIVDWRSIAKTEHGVFFQSNASVEDPKIYLLPKGSSVAVYVSEGIRDVLQAYPIVTSATRHDEEQLLTFTLQNTAGTDGRIVHLDLHTSGMGNGGWRGAWLVDRLSTVEAVQFPRILEERLITLRAPAGAGTLTFDLPRGRRQNDAIVVIVAADVSTANGTLSLNAVTGMTITQISTTQSITGMQSQAHVLRQTSGTTFTLSATVASSAFLGETAVFIKLWLVRGSDPATTPEATVVGVTAATNYPLPTLNPSWGSAKTLFLAGATDTVAFADVGNPVLRSIPAGFGTTTRLEVPSIQTSISADSLFCSRAFETASLAGAAFTSPFSSACIAWLIGIRPLTAGGTPVRAASTYRDRLVVCNDTLVMRADPDAVNDLGSAIIIGEWEHADIHPMGPAGAGRHLAVDIMFEVLGIATLYGWLSYDGGVTWTAPREYRLGPAVGFQVGQQCKVRWVPLRRKIDRVRLRLQVGDDTVIAGGATRGIALQRVTHWFEDLAGPARRQTSVTASIGDRR